MSVHVCIWEGVVRNDACIIGSIMRVSLTAQF